MALLGQVAIITGHRSIFGTNSVNGHNEDNSYKAANNVLTIKLYEDVQSSDDMITQIKIYNDFNIVEVVNRL